MPHTLSDTGTMEYRRLVETDAASWWRLRLEALETDPLAFGTALEEHSATTVAEAAVRFRNTSGFKFILGGFDRDRLVAVATFSREAGMKERHKAHIYGVYISPSHRGRRRGAELIETLLDAVRGDQTLEQILLGVGSENLAAIRTYTRFGFKTYGTEPRALKVGSEYVDEHLMVLRLS